MTKRGSIFLQLWIFQPAPKPRYEVSIPEL